MLRWGRLALSIRNLRSRIAADPACRDFTDEALRVTKGSDNVLETFAQKGIAAPATLMGVVDFEEQATRTA